jgi:hypothetical protein
MNAAGDRVAIGAYGNDGNGIESGHVRVYSWNGTAWTKLGLDIDGDGVSDFSGSSVSMNAAGDRVAIGAPSNGLESGHVRVYSWSGTAWIKLGLDIDGEAVEDYSGQSVSMNAAGDRVAIGAFGNDGNGSDAGHVRVYSWSGTAWIKLGLDIDGEAVSDHSGISVSMNAAGDRVAIGARNNDANASNAGHVRLYSWSGTAWIKLGLDIDGEAVNDFSGISVSMNAAGDRVAIGAYGNDGNGSNAGHVRVYHINDSDVITPKIVITETVEILRYGINPALIVGGRVGINTNRPSEALTVVGNISATGNIYGNVSTLNSVDTGVRGLTGNYNSVYTTVNSNSAKWVLEDFIVACSDESTSLTTTTSAVTFRVPFGMYLNSVRASVNVAPVGSTIIVDVKQSGSSIFSTKLSIDASEETSITAATPAVISNPNLTDDAKVIVSIDQIGSSTAGKGLQLTFKG